ncbi:hypothetical protein JCGZ_26557 [Jatropha curcas]|uniref:Uncharacterized protein n=1 Tax=Jatropha curcas TaxID=180498 RepID=A0A067L4R0_JATCU|nr:hypothetical protein JCGZ_26557 [Jatropha curcas]
MQNDGSQRLLRLSAPNGGFVIKCSIVGGCPLDGASLKGFANGYEVFAHGSLLEEAPLFGDLYESHDGGSLARTFGLLFSF